MILTHSSTAPNVYTPENIGKPVFRAYRNVTLDLNRLFGSKPFSPVLCFLCKET